MIHQHTTIPPGYVPMEPRAYAAATLRLRQMSSMALAQVLERQQVERAQAIAKREADHAEHLARLSRLTAKAEEEAVEHSKRLDDANALANRLGTERILLEARVQELRKAVKLVRQDCARLAAQLAEAEGKRAGLLERAGKEAPLVLIEHERLESRRSRRSRSAALAEPGPHNHPKTA